MNATTNNPLQVKIATYSVEMLKDVATRLMDNFENGSDMVFAEVLRALEVKMPTAEFVAFCDAL